jgi:hypothetical protein
VRDLFVREKEMEEIEQELLSQGRTPECEGMSDDDEITYMPSEETKT